MESHEVALKAVHHGVHVILGHGRVDLKVERGRRGSWVRERRTAFGVGERQIREVPPDVMRAWISHDHVFESAGIDLEIVIGVTPAANTIRRFVKEVGVVHVGRVWMIICHGERS